MTLDRSLLVHLPPPLIALGLLLAAAALETLLPSLRLLPRSPAGGLVWIGAGLTLSLASILEFLRIKTTLVPSGTPRQLITLGAYLWSRNPIYLGFLTALIGIAIHQGTLPFFLVPWLFFLTVNGIHIPYEEARLEAAFGSAFARYALKVRRWL